MLPDGFPAGLRVFVVNDDSDDLSMLEKMLLQCGYKDGFQLLEIMSCEINLPVIVLSVNSDFRNVMTSIKYGAVDYLVKPVRLEELQLIWKHVVKKFLNEKKCITELRSMDVNISYLRKKSKDLVRKRDEDDDIALKDNLASQKKARVSWTPELHAKFINAVNQLGTGKAIPMKILDIMDTPGLTRENVASHLQKYRKGLKRNTIELDQQIFDNAKTRRDSESFLPMTVNECNDNLNRNKSMFMGQQSYDGHALIPQTNFSQQSMMGSLENEFKTQQLGWTTESYTMNMSTQFSGNQQSLNQFDCQAQSYENSWTSNGHNELNPILQLESTIKPDATDMFLNNNHNDNNNFDELATLLAFEQTQQQNSSVSGAQISMDSIDVQSYSLDDHGGSNTSNLAILSEFDNMDDTDELYVALSQENLDSFAALSFVDCCSLHISPDHAIMSSNQNEIKADSDIEQLKRKLQKLEDERIMLHEDLERGKKQWREMLKQLNSIETHIKRSTSRKNSPVDESSLVSIMEVRVFYF
ncbi:hypothetical protein M5K25_027558 [Dendrobium thyrsiflorum]|uniref:Two-component response regulator n=1 Tax=Dendrobium thyrsiflorum TaxID=117978 RepID=A0ABD0TU92_DENTH